MDANLLHVSYEGGILEDPWTAPPPRCSDSPWIPPMPRMQPEEVVIGFEAGNPVSINGRELGTGGAAGLRRTRLAGRHGVGRVDIVENRFVGMKSRGVYETPGGTILHLAHRAVESITLDREVMHSGTHWCPDMPRSSTTASGSARSGSGSRASWTRSRNRSPERRGRCSTRAGPP